MSSVLTKGIVGRMLQPIVWVLAVQTMMVGQHITFDQYLDAGQEAIDLKDYFNAFQFYQEALAFDHRDSLTIRHKAGEAAVHSWRLSAASQLLDTLLSYRGDECDSSPTPNPLLSGASLSPNGKRHCGAADLRGG